MRRNDFLIAAFGAITLGTAAPAEPILVRYIQRPMHRFMVARSEAGKIIASGEFSQVVQSDEVTMRLTYKFVDGSIDDEMFWVCKMFYFPKGEMWIACVYDHALRIS
jgi:hypothetical protein